MPYKSIFEPRQTVDRVREANTARKRLSKIRLDGERRFTGKPREPKRPPQNQRTSAEHKALADAAAERRAARAAELAAEFLQGIPPSAAARSLALIAAKFAERAERSRRPHDLALACKRFLLALDRYRPKAPPKARPIAAEGEAPSLASHLAALANRPGERPN